MSRRPSKAARANRVNKTLSIAALIVGVLGLSIAFAAITRNLTINGVAEIQSPAWDIRFNTQSSSASGGATITSSMVDDHTISYHVVFTDINQSALVNFSVENTGLIDAEIASITTDGLDQYNLRHINFSLKYADDSNVAVGDNLLAGASRNMKINLNYVATQPEFIADGGSTASMTVKIEYEQVP